MHLRVYTFFPQKKIQGTVHILFKVATLEQRDCLRQSLIFILYLFCLNAQVHITVILKMKAGVILEIVVHFVCWFSASTKRKHTHAHTYNLVTVILFLKIIEDAPPRLSDNPSLPAQSQSSLGTSTGSFCTSSCWVLPLVSACESMYEPELGTEGKMMDLGASALVVYPSG